MWEPSPCLRILYGLLVLPRDRGVVGGCWTRSEIVSDDVVGCRLERRAGVDWR